MTRVYIAGPMSGYPDSNYPAFNQAARELRARGYQVENPAENPAPADGSWLSYMRMSLVQIAKADALVMLPGWQKSKGARAEFSIACDLGLPVHMLDAILAAHRTEAA